MKTATHLAFRRTSARKPRQNWQDSIRQDSERALQLADIAATGDEDNAACAAADLFREFPPLP